MAPIPTLEQLPVQPSPKEAANVLSVKGQQAKQDDPDIRRNQQPVNHTCKNLIS
jgi:hypothetical protein